MQVTINNLDPHYVYFQIDRAQTNYVNRIIEGYEYLGVMTTVNTDGLCMIRCTESTRELTKQVLSSVDVPLTILE